MGGLVLRSAERRNPLVSPLWADLRGLPSIYIQAGRAEILYPSIQAFADRAQKQAADVVLETWEDMTHDFQLFGLDSPPSVDALKRISQVIDARVRGQTNYGGDQVVNRTIAIDLEDEATRNR